MIFKRKLSRIRAKNRICEQLIRKLFRTRRKIENMLIAEFKLSSTERKKDRGKILGLPLGTL